MNTKRYWTDGLAAARANLLPGLALQALMVGLLLGYLFVPSVRDALARLAELKVEVGYLYAFVAGAVAGGVLPESLRVILLQRGKLLSENAVGLAFGGLFWGSMGVVVDGFYRLQGVWFGYDPTVSTVMAKVFMDMVVFTPLIGVPAATIGYRWLHSGFRIDVLPAMFTAGFYRNSILPVLIPNWIVWAPVVCVIYSLPPGLQIPVYVFAQAFWALLIMTLTARQQDAS